MFNTMEFLVLVKKLTLGKKNLRDLGDYHACNILPFKMENSKKGIILQPFVSLLRVGAK